VSEAPPDLAALTEACCAIARRAGAAILDVYAGAFAVQQKADRSPLTAADLAAHRTIVSGLRALAPQWPILSEESAEQAAWSERRHWRRYWLVDPLDGTREFVKRNGEFTVNIALIEQHVPVLGVVYAPALGELYWAWCGGQARYSTSSAAEAVPLRTCPRHDPLRVAGSRSHRDPRTAAALARLGRHEWIPLGSALKFCRAARGEVDLYLRFGPTCEWDTAAGQCVLEQAGGRVLTLDGETLAYNAKESLINPDFLACGDGTVDWARVLADGGRSDSVRP
jgi:3'(2'), 5'-bisphosphate nucleotidase